MRNTGGMNRGTWATYAQAAREGAGLSKSELGRRLGVDRATIHRWETGQTRPDVIDVVVKFADVLTLDLDEVVAAAGMSPTRQAPEKPTREPDPELEEILASSLPDRVKQDLIEHVLEQRQRDHERRMAEIQRMIRIAKRGA